MQIIWQLKEILKFFRIDYVENSTDLKNLYSIDKVKNKNSKERNQLLLNSISNTNSSNFKINSLIGDSRVKDIKILL